MLHLSLYRETSSVQCVAWMDPRMRASNAATCSVHFLAASRAAPPTTGKAQQSSKRNAAQGRGKKEPPQTQTAEVSPHRAFVVVRLLRVEFGGAFCDILSGADGDASWVKEMDYVEQTLNFRTRSLTPEDMKLVTEEVAGIVRWKRYLDFVISTVFEKSHREFDRLEPVLLMILRLGVYELLKLDMPAYAVVNESVKLATRAIRPGAGGLVNALLRGVARHKQENTVPAPELAGDERAQARALATIHSHPVWLVRRWMKRYGVEEAVKLMERNNTRPVFALRANSAKDVSRDDLAHRLGELKVVHSESQYLQDFVRVETGMQEVLRAGLVREGICTVQDESAGLVVALLDPQPGDVVIDCCAAPGGKTLYIASRLKGKGKVIAVDINKGRLRVLKEAAQIAGVSEQVSVYNVDARHMICGGPIDALADRVILDAPCSGLGVLSKRADLRWRRTSEGMKELTELQDELLEAASKMVRIGGVLVYSTCSIEPEENAERVQSFLGRNQNFVLEPAEEFVPKELASSEEGYFTTLPHEHATDGAFAARMRRTS